MDYHLKKALILDAVTDGGMWTDRWSYWMERVTPQWAAELLHIKLILMDGSAEIVDEHFIPTMIRCQWECMIEKAAVQAGVSQ